jgi:hypothetical protein
MKKEKFEEALTLINEINELKKTINSFVFEYKERRKKEMYYFDMHLKVSQCDITKHINRNEELRNLFIDKIDIVINEMEEEINYKINQLEKEFKEL